MPCPVSSFIGGSFVSSNTFSLTTNSTTQAFAAAASGLSSNTTYYYRTVFFNENNSETQLGSVVSFTTLATVETTAAATALTSSSAILNGSANPEGSSAYTYFEYGTNSSFIGGSFVSSNTFSLTTNSTTQAFAAAASGLSSDTTYYYRTVFVNQSNGETQFGNIVSFSTASIGALLLNPASLSFANQIVFTKSAAMTVTVTNPGTGAVSVTSITTTGSYPKSFPQTNTCGTSIAAAGSCTVSVVFDPQGTGPRSAFITLNTSSGTQSVPVSGVGITAPLLLSPTSIAFPNQVVFTKSAAMPVTVTNTGAIAISVTSIKTTGSNPNSFPQTNTCSTSIPAAGNCTIDVVFSPQGVGARSAAVTLTTSSGTQTIALSGSGITAPLQLNPASLTFPNQVVYTKSAAMPVTVTNSGAIAVSVTSIKTTGTNPNSFPQTNNCGTSIPAGGSCTMSVVFYPQGTGERSASITLSTSSGVQSVPLSGTGIAQ